MTALRIGAWAAVSSRAQATEDKSSLQDQEAAGRRFAEAVGGQVVAVYTVPGHSRDVILFSEAAQQMDAYAAVLRDWQAHRLDVLHAISADRLGRDAALVAQMYSLASRYNCEIYLSNAPHVLGQQTVASRIVPAILGIQAESENQAKVWRQKSGMRGRVLKRGLIGAAVAFGYRAVYEHRKVIGYELDGGSETVLQITGLFLRGLPYTQILQAMNAEGVPAPEGGHWVYSTVRRVCLNDTYAGLPRWAGQQPESPSERYPALWDGEMYQKIILERARRKRGGQARRGCSPFSGVAFCARCGKHMTRSGNHGYLYLRCPTHARRSMGVEGECHANLIPEHRIAEAIGAFLATEVTAESVRAAYQEREDTATDLSVELETARKTARELHAKRERLALAYAAGQMDLQIYRSSDDSIQVQETAQIARAQSLEAQMRAAPNLEARVAAVLDLVAHFGQMITDLEPAEVAAILQNAGLRVLVESGRVVEVGVLAS